MKNAARVIGKGVLLILAGVFAGTLLLVLAYMLPVNTENRDYSYETLEMEGWYPRASVSSQAWDTYFHSYLPDVLDGSSEKVMLYMAMDDSKGSPLYRAMESYNQYIGSYSYYWHGYVAVLRPLFLLFNYTELRIANSICQFLLVLALAFLIGREKGIRYVLMFATSYILLSTLALSMSLMFTWMFYISYIGTLILLTKRKFFAQKQRYLYWFMILGMLASYFDLMTYPLATWGIPLIWWITMDREDKKELVWVKQVVTSGIAWIAGYVLLWFMKWVLATIVLGQNVIETAMNEVFFRSGTSEGHEYALSARLEAIYSNWKHYEYKIYVILLAIWLIWWICQTFYHGGWKRDARRYAYLLTGISSIVYYFVVANQTAGHHFFAYRNFSVSVLAFLAIVLCSTSQVSKVKKVPIKKRLAVCGVLLAAVILSIPLTLLAREDILAINGSVEFTQIPMNGGDYFEVDFTPTFDEIKGFSLGLESESDKGYCELTLWDDDELKYQGTFWLVDFDGNLQSVEARWKLDRRKTYRMTLEVNDTVKPIYIWVTENRAMPLVEYGELSMNNQAVEGQLLTSIIYWTLPTSRKIRFFIAMTWLGVLLACGYALRSKTKKGELLYINEFS